MVNEVVNVSQICDVSHVNYLMIHNLVNIEAYSTVRRLVSVTAWFLRFIKNIRSKSSDRIFLEYLTKDERCNAMNIWTKINQNELRKNEKFDEINCSLNLVEDKNGLLRARGRIQRSNLSEKERNPVMLERSHKLTELIVLDCHVRVMHNGVRLTQVEF